MAQALQLRNGIGRKDLKAIRQRFFALHRQRLRRILGELRPSQQDLIILLPLLFHINHPMLPGFVNTHTPAGISDYGPSRSALRTARKISRSFSYKKRAQRRYRIQGLYLMGSIGTIAHTSGSDFDVWLCHDPALSKGETKALAQKALNIERWAADLGLEVHIFVMDADGFRRGAKGALSHESSGSTQHYLLLEEFYRTAVLLAGRYPLWWLVPPEEEGSYSQYAAMLVQKRFLDHRECIDFGGLESVPAEEFFGAALWQLFKGIDAPYKSVLKILLMEAYAHAYPAPQWLSQQTKAAIYAGETDISKLDPYLFIYREVANHLSRLGKTGRLELVRRCFYFKVGERLSQMPRRHRRNWRQGQMLNLTREWGWTQEDLVTLDSRPQWKMDKVMVERNALVRELSHSYRILTDFARAHAECTHIDPVELGLLGRKLYTALERRPGKVDRINPGISDDLVENYLSLHYADTQAGNPGWFLYRGQVDDTEARNKTAIKTTPGLIEMLAWCQINRINNRDTVFALYPDDCPVTSAELHAILDRLRALYPGGNQPEIALGALSEQASALSSDLFINVGRDPMAHLSREGKQLTSNRSDPLSFGAAHSSLVLNLEALVATSWGELLIHGYEGTVGLLEALCRYLTMTLLVKPDAPPPEVHAHGYSSIRAQSIARRVAQLFNDAGKAFGPAGGGQGTRYILQAGDDYFVLQESDTRFNWIRAESTADLLEVLAESQRQFRPLAVDRRALPDSYLPVIFHRNRAERIQLFYHTQPHQVDLFILDEQGALFQQSLRSNDHRYLLIQQQRFLTSLLRQCSLFVIDNGSRALFAEPEFFCLRRDWARKWHAEPEHPPGTGVPDQSPDLCLVTTSYGDQARPFALICGDQEFSALEYGSTLYHETARHVLGLRRNQNRDSVFLTGVESSAPMIGESPSILGVLNLKKHVENRLARALEEISVTLPAAS